MGTTDKGRMYLNLNTVLLTVGIGLSGWTLKTVFEISNKLSEVATRVDSHDRVLTGIDARVGRNEAEIGNLRVRLAGRAND